MSTQQATKRAIDNLGGVNGAAQKLGAKWPSRIRNWLDRGQVPAKEVLRISELSGVPANELRPDIFTNG